MKKMCVLLIAIILGITMPAVWMSIANRENNIPLQSNDDIFEFCSSNLQYLSELESVPIINNADPGKNPEHDSFGILGTLVYPLKNLDISDNDEVLIIIRPSDAVKSEEVYAYVAYNTNIIRQVQNEFCYFQASKGTTPDFYVSIYKNGDVIIEETGILGAHFSHLTEEFKPIMQ